MKTKRNKKSGFTLVELMVVAIIVAILAAVAIPLMTGNKDRAIATEGQAGCTTIATQLRMYWAENEATTTTLSDLLGIRTGDLDGTYFDDASGYAITSHAGSGTYTITATSRDSETVIMTVTDGIAAWSGTLLGDVVATP